MAAATAPSAPQETRTGVTINQGWWSQPAKNVLMIYLKEDVPSATILSHCERVLLDHGIPTTRKDSGLKVNTNDSIRFNVELNITTGRHPVSGNMVAIEMKTKDKTGEYIVMGLGVVLVAVAAVAVVALIAAAAGGNGGGHGGGGGGGDFFVPIIYNGSTGSGSRPKRKRVRPHRRVDATMYYSETVMYRPLQTSNRLVSTSSAPQMMTVDDATFKKADDFFQYLFLNFRTYFFNSGFVRVPSEAVSDLKAVPLDHRSQDDVLSPLQSRVYSVVIPEHACAGLCDTLRTDVISDKGLDVMMRHARRPARFTKSTILGREIGNHMYQCSAGPGLRQTLQPGVWYVTVKNTKLASVKYRICAKLFEDADKAAANPVLFGCEVGSTTVSEGGDEWEVVDQISFTESVTGQTGTNFPSVSTSDAVRTRLGEAQQIGADVDTSSRKVLLKGSDGSWNYDHLTQEIDLRLLSDTQLDMELVLRGITISATTSRGVKEAALFPLLPSAAPVPQVTPCAPSMAASMNEEELELDFDNLPYEFLCPITQELLEDPVMLADGFTYERVAITRWLRNSKMSPMTGAQLAHTNMVPNVSLQTIIKAWKEQNPENDYVDASK